MTIVDRTFFAATVLSVASIGSSTAGEPVTPSDATDGDRPPIASAVGDCGIQALTVALNQLGGDVAFRDLEGEVGARRRSAWGHSIAELSACCERRQFETALVRTTLDNLTIRPKPFACVAHVDKGTHFVAVIDVDPEGKTVEIFDARTSSELEPFDTLDYEAFQHRWEGVALLVATTPLVPEENLRRPISWPVWAGVFAGTAGLLVLAAWPWIRARRLSCH